MHQPQSSAAPAPAPQAVGDYSIGHLLLQPRRQLLDGNHRLPLGSKALALISLLAERGGELVTKDELMDGVWPRMIVEENVIQVHVAALRKLLGRAADRLVTVRGVGYRLDAVPVLQRAADQLLVAAPLRDAAKPAQPVLPCCRSKICRATRNSRSSVTAYQRKF